MGTKNCNYGAAGHTRYGHSGEAIYWRTKKEDAHAHSYDSRLSAAGTCSEEHWYGAVFCKTEEGNMYSIIPY